MIRVIKYVEFDLKTALKFAYLCSEAYHPSSKDIFLNGEETDAGCLIKFEGKVVKLIFRGTRNVADWLADFDIKKTSIGYGLNIHSGFLKYADSILPKILNCVSEHYKHKYDYYRLFKKIKFQVSGHSLGGALCELVAFFLNQEGFNVDFVYSFAAPRVGNNIWKKVYNKNLYEKTFRICMAGDLVPHLPVFFLPFLDSYRHVGIEILLTDEQLIINPSHNLEIIKDGFMAFNALRKKNFDFIVKFHSIDKSYIKTLKKH